MPSPFPGMDPYIEDQGRWLDFHSRFVPYCCDALNDRLPEPYVAQLEEQLELVEWESGERRGILPDVTVTTSAEGRAEATVLRGSTALLEPATVPLPVEQEQIRYVWIEIRRLPEFQVVTVIEVLSPTNKAGAGAADYRRKRLALIRQDVHLVEIDLLLGGQRLPMGRPLPPGDFYALVSRAERRPNTDVYAWSIRRALPTIPIPLVPPDPDVPLELAAVFTSAYERGRYARSLNYAAALSTPLADEDRTWARDVLRARPL